jgi:UDP-2-acetamido-2-deoxy-ribo-hexuluronate aminotransferase
MEVATEPIQMLDLRGQYARLRTELDSAIQQTLLAADFINGSFVQAFQQQLAQYLRVERVIGCGNGTDALQIALMALGVGPGDEILVPAFTYVATAEVVALLGATPVWVDVDPDTFGLTAAGVEQAITPRTKAVVPVHLYGQCVDMASLMEVARAHNIAVVEDTAQAIGAEYTHPDGSRQQAGTIGTVGCTSFFPSKNLGCYGDGGAMYTNDVNLAERLRMIANHGQREKYIHEIVGVNSRLDTLQAAVLTVKLRHLPDFTYRRQQAAQRYDEGLATVPGLQIPTRRPDSTHVFHQYTLKVADDRRDALKQFLKEQDIPSMIYYPLPMYRQPAYSSTQIGPGSFPVAESLAKSVLSLPMHTELTSGQQERVIMAIRDFMGRH